MRSPHGFIVEPIGGLYKNTMKTSNGDLIVSVTMEDAKTVNREAEVICTPSWYDGPIEEGAIVIIHHNNFRKYHDAYGKEVYSSDLIRENTYVVKAEDIFLYKNDVFQDWSTTYDWCFILPREDHEPLHGTVRFGNKYLTDLGINEGDDICFTPDSEYEFRIDEEVLYKMKSSDIWLKTSTEKN